MHAAAHEGSGAYTYKNIYIILKTIGPYFIHNIDNVVYCHITDNVTFLKDLQKHISHSGIDRRSDTD